MIVITPAHLRKRFWRGVPEIIKRNKIQVMTLKKRTICLYLINCKYPEDHGKVFVFKRRMHFLIY